MSEKSFQELENLKTIYSEIVLGYSYIDELDIYIKHLSELDNIYLNKIKKNTLNKLIKDGIPSYKDRLKTIIENGEWSEKEEDQIISLKFQISDNQKNINTIIAQQRPVIEKVISDKKNELTELLFKKRNTLNGTAEDFAEQEHINYLCYFSIFKNKELTEKPFKDFEQFENLDESLLNCYLNKTDQCLTKFNETNIKKIAAMGFFINLFSYVKEDISKFLGIPISRWTDLQFLLFSLGNRNLNVLSQCEGEPPIIQSDDDISKCVDWFDQQYSIICGKRNTKKN